MHFIKHCLAGLMLLPLLTASGQSNDYGSADLGVSNAYYDQGPGPNRSNDFPMLTIAFGYFRSVNKDFSIGIEAPLSIFLIKNFDNSAVQCGFFAMARSWNGASKETRSRVGFFGGAGILWHYTEELVDDAGFESYLRKRRMLGLAYQAGIRLGSKNDPGMGFSLRFTYATDFKVSEKKLFDVKLTFTGIL